jgi:hypothetical protein
MIEELVSRSDSYGREGIHFTWPSREAVSPVLNLGKGNRITDLSKRRSNSERLLKGRRKIKEYRVVKEPLRSIHAREEGRIRISESLQKFTVAKFPPRFTGISWDRPGYQSLDQILEFVGSESQAIC